MLLEWSLQNDKAYMTDVICYFKNVCIATTEALSRISAVTSRHCKLIGLPGISRSLYLVKHSPRQAIFPACVHIYITCEGNILKIKCLFCISCLNSVLPCIICRKVPPYNLKLNCNSVLNDCVRMAPWGSMVIVSMISMWKTLLFSMLWGVTSDCQPGRLSWRSDCEAGPLSIIITKYILSYTCVTLFLRAESEDNLLAFNRYTWLASYKFISQWMAKEEKDSSSFTSVGSVVLRWWSPP